MKHQQDTETLQQKQDFFSNPVKFYSILGIGFLAILAFLLFGTISTDLSCVRTVLGIECSLTHNTSLLKMNPIKICDPIAVDIKRTHGKGGYSYTAELRSGYFSYNFPLLSDYSFKAVQSAADEVNTFLLSSNQPSFFKSFPGIF